jgi:hypothetical protein
MGDPRKGLMKEHAKIADDRGGADCEGVARGRRVTEDQAGDRDTKGGGGTNPTRLAEGKELRFGGVDGKTTPLEPASAELEVFADQAGRFFVGVRDCNKGPVVDVKLCRATMPALCQAEEWSSVQRREDGGEGGALRRATEDRVRAMCSAIEADGGGAAGKEVHRPSTDRFRVTVGAEEGDHAITPDVIEETPDIEEQDRRGLAGGHRSPSDMGKTQGGVHSAVVVPGAELGRGQDVKGVRRIKEAPRDDPLEKLATALEKGDGAIGGGGGIVRLAWFGKGHDQSMLPRMDTIGQGSVKQVNKALGGHPERPLDELVRQAARAGGGAIRGVG